MAIQSGSETVRRNETLYPGKVSVYDEGTKDYIELNRLLDFIAEFLWKSKERIGRFLQVNGLNEITPSFDYETYYGGRVIKEPHEFNYTSPPLPNSFPISCNRPQYGDKYYNKPSNLSESFNTHPAKYKIGLREKVLPKLSRGDE